MEACGDLPDVPEVTASDICDGDVPVMYSEEVIGASCPLTVLRTWTATDACGNTTTASQTISVTNTPPAGCPEDVDGDLFVGVSDVLAALGEFGCTGGCSIDFDGDDATTVSDVLTLLSAFGEACP